MKINCRCGRVLKVTKELAGKKVRCKECGQKYRLPKAEPDPTMQVKAWSDNTEQPDAKAAKPEDVGAVALGEKLAVGWVLASVIITLVTSLAGIVGVKHLMQMMASGDLTEYSDYIKLGMFWGPSLAFVVSGWIVARFSPGRTIAEPAIGAAITVAVLVGLLIFKPGPLEAWLTIGGSDEFLGKGTLLLKLNLFALGMFNAACLACAGAYFGEVAQERTDV